MAFVHIEEKVDTVSEVVGERVMNAIIKSMSDNKKCLHEYLKDYGIFRCSKCDSKYILCLQPLKNILYKNPKK